MSALSQEPCTDCLVKNRALCRVLDAGALAAFSQSGRRRFLVPGESLAWQGDADAPCATVISGAVKLSSVDAEGEERIVGLALPADFVGLPFEAQASLQATALVRSELCIFPRDAFVAALDENRELERELLRRTMGELVDARASDLRSASRSARERVASLLVQLHGRGASGCAADIDPDRLELPLSRGEIAQLLDVRIETVSREIVALEEDSLLKREGRSGIRILDAAGLCVAAGMDG